MSEENQSKELERIRREVFDFVMEEDPIMATGLGVHDYDGDLPERSRQAQQRKIRKFDGWRSELADLEAEKLDGDERDSLKVGKYLLDLKLFELKELRKWEKNPNGPQLIGGSLLPLLKRNFAPLEERLRSARSRIEGVPGLLNHVKGSVKDPVDLWVKVALESLERLPALLDVVEETAGDSELSDSEREGLGEAIAEAKEALADFGDWLKKEAGNGEEEFAIGPDRFSELLEKRRLGYDVGEITELGKKYLAESRDSMEKYARRIDEDYSVRDAMEEVESNKPADFSKALSWYEESIYESKSFVEDKNLATIPDNEGITVMETPAYLRNLIPFAAYIPPAKYDEEREGVYLVTPPGEGEDLSRFAFWTIRNTTVHEGYPGHHLQMSASAESDDLFRLLARATETVEGWAHYCEEMMKDYGFDDTPEARLIQLRDRRWRAARIIADVKLSTGEFSFREGVEYMADTVDMDESSAEAEVKRYTQNPSYQLSYLLGKHKIDLLKEDVRRKMGGDYRDRFFHDELIYGGSIPLEFHRDRFNRLIEGGAGQGRSGGRG